MKRIPFAHLGTIGDVVEVPAGRVLFKKGDEGDSMYVVLDGRIQLLFEDARSAKELGAGDYFGELALLTRGHKRTATAVAMCRSRLAAISQAEFHKFLMERPTEGIDFLKQVCLYLMESEEKLVASLEKRNRELEQALDYLKRTRELLSDAEIKAQTDPLTGLYNRLCLERHWHRVVRKAENLGMLVGLILIDLDKFKDVNDMYGHLAGDMVLKAVAGKVKDAASSSDLPLRLGGDEFALLLLRGNEGQVKAAAEQLLSAVRHLEVPFGNAIIRPRCSVGCALLHSGENWEQLYTRADHGLYKAKSSGRDTLTWVG